MGLSHILNKQLKILIRIEKNSNRDINMSKDHINNRDINQLD